MLNMSDHQSVNPKGRQRTEPALLITTQTTVPVLTQLMVAFSLAAVGIAASSDLHTTIRFSLFELTTREITLGLFVVSVFLFVFATESCIRSHSWDYFAVSDERRRFLGFSDDRQYIMKCLKLSETWHALAVWSFRVGMLFTIVGAAFLVWPLAHRSSYLIAVCVPVSVIVSLWAHYQEKQIFESSSPLGALDSPRLKNPAVAGEIDGGTSMTFHIYKDHKGEWWWRLKGANGKEIANSTEGYSSKQDCKINIDLMRGATIIPIVEED
jgi:uncharacterized protein YegP (UPF0339 family)